MRLSTALLVCLVSASAAQAEDRFGPPPSRSAAAEASANGFSAPVYDPSTALRWSRKVQSQDVASADVMTLQPKLLPYGLLNRTSASPMARNRPMVAIGAQGQTQTQTQAQVQTQAMASNPPAYALPSPAMAPNAGAAPIASLPTSLFDDAAAPAPSLASSAVAAAAAPATVPRSMTGGQAIGANGEVGSRYYSVHRGYGVDADPIPMSQTGVGQ